MDASRLTRGPLVYCLEQVDNGPDLDAVALPSDGSFVSGGAAGSARTAFLRSPVLEFANRRRPTASTQTSHRRNKEINVTAVPYYAWNNRGPGEMLVWIRGTME